jgi:flagellum-specific peptidoglycan hydrolase FlgJ
MLPNGQGVESLLVDQIIMTSGGGQSGLKFQQNSYGVPNIMTSSLNQSMIGMTSTEYYKKREL